MQVPPAKSFTASYNGLAATLHTKVRIQTAFDQKGVHPLPPKTEYTAIWDTGATKTAISQRVVTDCALQPTGMCKVQTAAGEKTTCTYFVSLYLPNMVYIPQIRVSQVDLVGADVLIGMDVICAGDFAVTNFGKKTTLSFRMPPGECIDFVRPKPASDKKAERIPVKNLGRNDPCHCGSGKKYKKCHGK